MYAAITKGVCAWTEDDSHLGDGVTVHHQGNVKKHRVSEEGKSESCHDAVFVQQDMDPDRKLQKRLMGATLEQQIAKAMRGENGTVVIPPAAAHECQNCGRPHLWSPAAHNTGKCPACSQDVDAAAALNAEACCLL